ncbi:MAG TPA: hypothetical protein VHJ40_06595 [Actinomycetota bacterium]|nr:hypothetical protein [Actinomycetota bacterium]
MTERRVGRRRIQISNPGKVLYPDSGITKSEVVGYYAEIAPVMLEHRLPRAARGRALRRGDDFDEVGLVAERIAMRFDEQSPRTLIVEFHKVNRNGRIFGAAGAAGPVHLPKQDRSWA